MATTGEPEVIANGKKSEEYEQKKERMIQQIQRRQEERVADIKKRQEERENRSAKNESTEYFLTTYGKEKTAIETSLKTVDSLVAAGTSKSELISTFDDLTRSAQALQKFVTNSSLFITPYDLNQTQRDVERLQLAVLEKRDAAIPKKKFAFKARKKETQQNNNSKASADNISSISKPLPPGKENRNDGTDLPDSSTTNGSLNMLQFQCGIFSKTDETIKLTGTEINGKDVGLTNLKSCTVQLFGTPSAVHMDRITDCKIFCGPVPGSVFVDNCTDSTLVLSCQQLRVHHTKDVKFYLHVTSRGIIEDTSQVQFAPYNWTYPGIEDDYKRSELDQARNSWDDIDDFNWLASDKHSPNWSLIPENERENKWNTADSI